MLVLKFDCENLMMWAAAMYNFQAVTSKVFPNLLSVSERWLGKSERVS